MNRVTTAENAAAPRHGYPTPGNPLVANSMLPRAVPGIVVKIKLPCQLYRIGGYLIRDGAIERI